MEKVASADGTQIAFERFGSGPPLVMVAGAFNDRSTTEPLGRVLADRLEVFNYDRRGRGDSNDTAPYAVAREIEDLDAVIATAGADTCVFGYSSGANLVLSAAAAGSAIGRMILYEPPLDPSGNYPTVPSDLPSRLHALVQAGDRGAAVELFQTIAIGMPEHAVIGMRSAPFRPGLEAIAHTLAYDAAILGNRQLSARMLAEINTPTLVISGARSDPFLRHAAAAVAAILPAGKRGELAGQAHTIDPEATATIIDRFLNPD